MTKFSLDDRLAMAERNVRDRVNRLRDALDSIEVKLRNNRVLNDLGEVQQLGNQLDCSIAVLATLQDIRRNGLLSAGPGVKG